MRPRSYTSLNPARHWARDFLNLARGTARNTAHIEAHVRGCIEQCRDAERAVAPVLRRDPSISRGSEESLHGLDLLEIGVGQLPRQMGYFAGRGNRVVGIDLDVIPRGLALGAYVSLAQTNGVKRLVKTLGRKALGFDRAFFREMARQLGIPRLPPLDVRQMDATAMTFAPGSFDLVYSFDVFEHLPEPAKVMAQAREVLRPRGVFHTLLHPFTAEDGAHDLRIISGNRGDLGWWAHLRPSESPKVEESAYLNKIRIADWRRIIEAELPGAIVTLPAPTNVGELRARLAELRSRGELVDYSDEELLAARLVVVWQKPR
jgi:SAM-dependent methyltransferase